jgi:hypothetical protein
VLPGFDLFCRCHGRITELIGTIRGTTSRLLAQFRFDHLVNVLHQGGLMGLAPQWLASAPLATL